MYPTIQNLNLGPLGTGQSPIPAAAGISSYYPALGQPSASPAASVAQASSPASTSHFPLLRVQIAPQLRTAPPVPVAPNTDNVPRTQFAYDFDFERRMIQSEASSTSGRQVTIVDPYSAPLEQLKQQGFSREAASLALAVHGDSQENRAKVVEFCKNFRQLKELGFSNHVIVGALILHPDVEAATESCLAVAH